MESYSHCNPKVIPSPRDRVSGPTMTNARKPVTIMVISGVSKKSTVPLSLRRNHFSVVASRKLIASVGTTWP